MQNSIVDIAGIYIIRRSLNLIILKSRGILKFLRIMNKRPIFERVIEFSEIRRLRTTILKVLIAQSNFANFYSLFNFKFKFRWIMAQRRIEILVESTRDTHLTSPPPCRFGVAWMAKVRSCNTSRSTIHE